MSDFPASLACSAPSFGKGGQGGIHTPYPQANVVESPLTPLFLRGEHFCRAIKA